MPLDTGAVNRGRCTTDDGVGGGLTGRVVGSGQTEYPTILKMPGWDPGNKLVGHKWDVASETFAKNSTPDTRVVFPDKPSSQTSTGIPNPHGDIYPYRRPDNVFDKIEYPKLEEQGIKVTEHNAETGATRPYQKPPSVKP